MGVSELGGGIGIAEKEDRTKSSAEVVRPPRRRGSTGARLVGAIAVVVAAGAAGFTFGSDSRQPEVDTAHSLNAAQDWLLDRDFTGVVTDNGITERDGTIYVRLEDPEHCAKPVSFEFTGDALLWGQRDQEGSIIDRVEVKDASYAANVLADICPEPR